MRGTVRLSATVAVMFLLAACASRQPLTPRSVLQNADAVELTDTAFFPQDDYQCGPAALATVLHSTGAARSPDTLAKQVYLPARRGSLQPELLAATRRAARIPYIIDPSLQALRAELDAGRPVLVLQNLGLDLLPVWHYAVVIGLQPDADRVVLRSGTERRHIVPAREFLRTWRLAENWAMVVLRPGELPTVVDPSRYLQAVASSERYLSPAERKAAYRVVLGRWPADPTARFGLAYSLHLAGELAAAESAYIALLDGHPRHAAAFNNLADVLRKRGCFSGAREAAANALEIALREYPALVTAIRETQNEIPAGEDLRSCDWTGAKCKPDSSCRSLE